jgi:tetratricopeptide (TPR) repeat protein
MKIKTVYIYVAIFIAAIVVLIAVDFGGNDTSANVKNGMPNDAIHQGAHMPNDAIHQGARMPNDAIHKGLSSDDEVPNKSNVKPEYYRTLDSLKTTYENNPNDTTTAFKYIEYLVAGHGADKAVKVFEDLLQRFPNSVSVMMRATYVYYQLGEVEKAKALLEKVHRIQPENMTAYYNLGLIAFVRGDSVKAKRIWTEIIKKKPNSEEAQFSKEALDRM